MKYLAIITLALFICSCENEGKKKEVLMQAGQTCEPIDKDTKQTQFKGCIKSAKDSTVLSGAFIIVPGTNIGTMTGPDGKFIINAPDGTIKLAFVMDGYEKANVAVDEDKENEIYMSLKNE